MSWRLAILALLVLGSARCQSGPPQRFPLYEPEVVLVLTFETSDAGLKLLEKTLEQGVPTESILLDRPVLVTALDEDGRPVTALSAPNPREIHTAGTKDPEQAILPRARFTVRLADPARRIEAVRVEIREGPNAGLSRIFPAGTRGMVLESIGFLVRD